MSYTILRISDGQHVFPFLYDGKNIYCPDYNPLVYNKNPQYCFSYAKNPTVEPKNIIFDSSGFLACAPFRYEGYNYCQYRNVAVVPSTYYINLYCLKDGEPDPDYTSVQSAGMMDVPQLSIVTGYDQYGIFIEGKKSDFETLFKTQYGYPNTDVVIETEVAVMDENDIYWQSAGTIKSKSHDFNFALTTWPFASNTQWKDDLRIVGLMHVTLVQPNGEIMHINLRSKPNKLNEIDFARLISVVEGNHTITGLTNMVVKKPRIINKDIIQVVEMTAQTDSKSNIIQPVFFRTRELANIIVHPEVTENICINLDAYKAQATRFFIKIEGVTFQEIGRVESGVIFKVQGNMLPGKVAGGVYYILDQDTNLVTTGKYVYEA